MAFQLSSSAFADGDTMPVRYTCKGENISPSLRIAGAPSGTAGFALIMHDPDAPHGDYIHWLIWNVPPPNRHLFGRRSTRCGSGRNQRFR